MIIENFELANNIPFYKNKILKIHINSQGYLKVIIEKKTYSLHRLVAIKYIKNVYNYPIVDHIDNDKNNFQINNLQWLTYSQNSKKSYVENKKQQNRKSRIILSIKNDEIIEHKSLRKCAKYVNRDVAGVYRVLNGEWNLCNGYKLKYKL